MLVLVPVPTLLRVLMVPVPPVLMLPVLVCQSVWSLTSVMLSPLCEKKHNQNSKTKKKGKRKEGEQKTKSVSHHKAKKKPDVLM